MADKTTTAHKLYEIALLISRLVLMNLLWIAFVALGLVVAGIVPATVSVVGVFRAYERDGDGFSWLALAWRLYVDALRRFWFLSVAFSAAMVSLLLSSWVLDFQQSVFGLFPGLLMVYLGALALPYFAANEASFEMGRLALVTNALRLPLAWGLTSLTILLAEAAVAALCFFVPGLIPLVGVSIPLFLACSILTKRWNRALRELGQPELRVAREPLFGEPPSAPR
ncbi:MAG TPA: DUF624 domain-containing protein [Arachnia sp.]|nr:DUF624 domain-containing protein [Arachnia sp.]HMT87111.1 DUF624 domain-containing protein [Arachnia sp.]